LAWREDGACDRGDSDFVVLMADSGHGPASTVSGSWRAAEKDGVDGGRAGEEQVRRRRRECRSMLLFTVNAGSMLLLWMIGVVYTGAVVRTLERRFALRRCVNSSRVAFNEYIQTVYWILAASKGWIKQTYRKIMHTQYTQNHIAGNDLVQIG